MGSVTYVFGLHCVSTLMTSNWPERWIDACEVKNRKNRASIGALTHFL